MDTHKGVTLLDLEYYTRACSGTFIDFYLYYAETSDTSDTVCNVAPSVLYRWFLTRLVT